MAGYSSAPSLKPVCCLPAFSLLAQTRVPDQTVVVDNASTDGTGEAAAIVEADRLSMEKET